MPLVTFITVDSQAMLPVMSKTVDSLVMASVMPITVNAQVIQLFMSKYQFVMCQALDFQSHVARHLKSC